jgi:2-C-methyl-D-erythritol 4-phosphate cytidylyltransferase
MNKYYTIIVAGGSGTRMKQLIPKQFIEVNGFPILMHTIRTFAQLDFQTKIIVVLPADQFSYWQELCAKFSFTIPHQITAGGPTRFHSVKNGLGLVRDSGIIGIHDAVRPCASKQTIQKAYEMALTKGTGIPCVPLNDSIREVKNNSNKALDRNQYRIIQTPQCFQSALIQKAFQQDYQETFTDDASVVEAMGTAIQLVEGNVENIKITTPSDLLLAETFLKHVLPST